MQQALNTVPWKSSIKEIALLNKMSFEQVQIIERETMFVLYGFEAAEDYISNMVREAQINEEVATTIATAVDEKIFKAIALQLEPSTPEKPPQTPPPASPSNLPQTIHNSLPMIEEGEVVHDVAPATSEVRSMEKEVSKVPQPPIPPVTPPAPIAPKPAQEPVPEPKKVTPPASGNRYPEGFDPYREPLV